MFFGIVAIAMGAIAILDSIFHFFPRVIVQGHVVQETKPPYNTMLRVVEGAIGIGAIVIGIMILRQG